ncbi:hypothetical protein GOP47_0011517 [Adiantum capillus-veneris]|uniref:Lipoxygenase n=1 Tax=Adiantum capillus-veneris TaxID=13818 RepID=A0A9D4USY7_ADICA|nr:hypothetical protein GOP47_0011517 [Adiantum capillus-veneris]
MESLSLIQGKVEISKEGLLDSVAHSISALLGSKINLQLVSLALDPATQRGKLSAVHKLKIGTYLPSFLSTSSEKVKKDSYLFPCKFDVAQDFGPPGAIVLDSEVAREFFVESITLQLPGSSEEVQFLAKTWINESKLYNGPRILFADKAYLPCDTPKGLEKLRKEELVNLQGDGTGERKSGERIYDYALYDNLGNPDLNADLTRPVLGGSKSLPYPRRCRTGGKHTKADPASESPTASTYLPRDEVFSSQKSSDISNKGIRAAGHEAQTLLSGEKPFKSFEDLQGIYAGNLDPSLSSKYAQDDGSLLKFPPPTVVQANKQGWMTDEEFARQRLAGMNPAMIQRLKTFPPESTLDADVYGPEKCNITEDHLEGQLEGLTVEQALHEKRLYILDYHNSAFTPLVAKINEGEGKVYTSRTLFFLTKAGVLLPVVIELLLPPKLPSSGETWTNRVFTPPPSGKIDWLWQLAKGHVALVDTCHQHLCSHWLKTHACMEPFIIATRRHLSGIHPINMLLSPHFKDTMGTNQGARQTFLNSDGRIERCFVTGKHSNEVSSIDYGRWQFDEQAISKDLIRRGMAEPDEDAEHGLRLHIEDYPYAKDGLDLWAAIHTWVKEYISIYYENDTDVEMDDELQAWWTEVREVGHGDHKGAQWWEKMVSKTALVEAISTLLWMATGLHAVAGFGQYPFAGFMPNSPTMGRRLIPEEGSKEHKELLGDPRAFFLASFSSQREATTAMGTFEITSQHMSEEVYLGGEGDVPPSHDPRVVAAHERFRASIAALHDVIHERTAHPTPHRAGPSEMPFTLLLPFSPAGLTARGIANSISI